MLGGLDPVIIFQFSKLAPTVGTALSKIPLVSDLKTFVEQPPIPVYLSERFFNVAIVGTSKSVDIETDTETKTDGSAPDINQKGIQSGVEIHIEGKTSSVALILLSSLIDLAFDKATSKEYSISFIYGATTVFRGVLHTYSAEMVEGTDKLSVKIGISKGSKNPTKPNPVKEVPSSGPAPLPGDVA